MEKKRVKACSHWSHWLSRKKAGQGQTKIFLLHSEIKSCSLQVRINFWTLASLIAQLVKNPPAMQETPVQFLGWNSIRLKIPWRRERLPTPVFWPREFHGLYSPWSHKQLDMTERLLLSLSFWTLSLSLRPIHPYSPFQPSLESQHWVTNRRQHCGVKKTHPAVSQTWAETLAPPLIVCSTSLFPPLKTGNNT